MCSSDLTDSVFQKNSIYELFKPFKNVQLIDVAINSVNSTNQIINAKKREIALKEKIINKHIISFYEKFALGFACIILFFIGAPLGALIRKGGFGLPIIIAIILFLTYHFIGIFAKNSAEDSTLNPVIATWLSTLFMLPLSVYLTNRATKDRSLLDLDAVLIPIKKLLSKKEDVQVEDHTLLDVNSEAYSHLLNYSNDKLIDILKNYRQYELHISYYNTALQLLDSRGLSKQNLKFGGNLVNENYENALRYKSAYDDYSRIELVLYITYVVFGVGGLVLNNNGFPTLGPIFIIIGVLSFIIFIIALIKAYINQTNFYKLLENNKASNIIALILLGIPLNFIYKGFFSKKFEDDLKQIR